MAGRFAQLFEIREDALSLNNIRAVDDLNQTICSLLRRPDVAFHAAGYAQCAGSQS